VPLAAQPNAPAPIRVLSPLVANQIAAGEVVERPASVVKELLENALDAGATRIVIDLEQGGVELVRVTDDGRGIPADELPLALAPHATSKIADAADLDHIASLGFRGEALASISSVARVQIRSRTRDAVGASSIDAEGERISPVAPAAGPVGTSVSVRNLFFNTPARRKFLKTIPTEQGRCMDAVRDLALAHPAVAFRATADGRVLLDLPPDQSPKARAVLILGEELAPELLEVSADQFDDARGLALWGLVGRPSLARPTSRHQHLFVNGRAIRDRTVQHALAEAYRGLIEPSRYPTAVLMMEMSPAGVDVNVHPAKAEVRFRDSGLVHSAVFRAVRDALRAADLTPALHWTRPAIPDTHAAPAGLLPAELPGPGAPPTPPDTQRFVDFFKHTQPAPTSRFDYQTIKSALDEPPAPSQSQPQLPLTPRPTPRVLQVHKSFLVTEDESGVVIIDQHALHERVMFEYLLARVTARASSGDAGLESQQLLTPVVIDATPQQIERLPDLQPLLVKIGITAEPFGVTSVGISAFPSFLFDRGVDPAEMMKDLLENAQSRAFAPESEEALRDTLDMMACKAAIKAGDRMSDLELEELIKLRSEVERSSNCPHGRPTSIRLSIRELEKLFGRS
jgi:DNA mismatch repair protein MutL